MMTRIVVRDFEFFVQETRTRFPFKYGIASMTEVPHYFVRVRAEIDGKRATGLASEGLPPKWFTKDPATTFEQDLPDMIGVIHRAAAIASEVASAPVTFFDLWSKLTREQMAWAAQHHYPPLLASLGVSLVERAVLDALCRAEARPLQRIVHQNDLGIRLGDVYPELTGAQPADLLPPEPLNAFHVRHTVGLGDPITKADIPGSERVDDGLPHDLESCIRAYGLRYFKIKLCGDAERDFERLRHIAAVLSSTASDPFYVTLDGNENYRSYEHFRDFWDQAAADDSLRQLWRRILVVEQPVHRNLALDDSAGNDLRGWRSRPPVIIDESDGAIGDLPRALELGYTGTSHKNCKGIIKGIANACLIEKRRREGARLVLTGEDLCNLGPVALLQDLAMMSLLRIEHVERNGHHYYRGLTPWPVAWNAAVIEHHGDLYEIHADGFATLRIRAGQAQLSSVNAAPFGVSPLFDPADVSRQASQ